MFAGDAVPIFSVDLGPKRRRHDGAAAAHTPPPHSRSRGGSADSGPPSGRRSSASSPTSWAAAQRPESISSTGRLALERSPGRRTGAKRRPQSNRWCADIDLRLNNVLGSSADGDEAAWLATVQRVASSAGASAAAAAAQLTRATSSDRGPRQQRRWQAARAVQSPAAAAEQGSSSQPALREPSPGSASKPPSRPSSPRAPLACAVAARSEAWVAYREEKRKLLRLKCEIEQGSFVPELHRPERSPRWLASCQGGGDLHQRGLRAKARRESDFQRRRENLLAEELRECSFAPDISKSWPPLHSPLHSPRRSPSRSPGRALGQSPAQSPQERSEGRQRKRRVEGQSQDDASGRECDSGHPKEDDLGTLPKTPPRSPTRSCRSASPADSARLSPRRAVTPDRAAAFFDRQLAWRDACLEDRDRRSKEQSDCLLAQEARDRQPESSERRPATAAMPRTVYERQMLWRLQLDRNLEEQREERLAELRGERRQRPQSLASVRRNSNVSPQALPLPSRSARRARSSSASSGSRPSVATASFEASSNASSNLIQQLRAIRAQRGSAPSAGPSSSTDRAARTTCSTTKRAPLEHDAASAVDAPFRKAGLEDVGTCSQNPLLYNNRRIATWMTNAVASGRSTASGRGGPSLAEASRRSCEAAVACAADESLHSSGLLSQLSPVKDVSLSSPAQLLDATADFGWPAASKVDLTQDAWVHGCLL
eukprot:TRINITY_DN16643_c0_g1_i1.p1 TRINITY_DN16643_c0_g1~~TRINITY_DN16643_c0_g1_i1.p1  ORF type:complete len:713 (+),score=112.31 TRINITY_DN16643_c0_g1_i1:82-2220(+)